MATLQSWLPAFLRPKDPKELVQKWRREIRKQKNQINRDIRNLQMEQKKVERSIKDSARRNDLVSAKVFLDGIRSFRSRFPLSFPGSQIHCD